jgi:vanillate O-demethylase monooxygenase subunit
MVDNLMDLTHETYVHTTSIGQKEIDETPVTTKTEGEHVITSRFMDNVMPPPFWKANLRGNNLADDVPVDRWQVCHFSPPSHVMIEVGVAHAGKGGYDADPKDKVSSIVVDFLTPETETTMWYFWGMARNFNPKDKNLTAQIRDGQAKVFAEDTEVLEAQQRNLLLHPARKLLLLNIDAGGVQSRRIIDRLIAAEQPHPNSRSSSRPEPNMITVQVLRKTQEAIGICSYELARPTAPPCPPSAPARTSTCRCPAA